MEEKTEYKLKEEAIQEALESLRGVRKTGGLSTGFSNLDYLLGGLCPGDLIVLGSREGMGKTDFALNLAMNLSIRDQNPVFYISLASTTPRLLKRLLCMLAGVHLAPDQIPNDDTWVRLTNAAEQLSNAKLVIEDEYEFTRFSVDSIDKLLSNLSEPPKLLIVDYLELMIRYTSPDAKNTDRGNIFKGLKEIGKKYGCAILVLAYVSRITHYREDHRPRIEDLMCSVEGRDAIDAILFLYRDEFYTGKPKDRDIAEIIVAKSHNLFGTARFDFSHETSVFSELDEEERIGVESVTESTEKVNDSDFYERWCAKFGKPQQRTMRGDEFMKRLKEMIEFE